MFRFFLVPTGGGERQEAAFHVALDLARPVGGHLQFLHVRADPQMLLATMAAGDFGGGTGIADIINTLQRDIDARHDAARQAVLAFCAHEKVAMADAPEDCALSASFRVETGNVARLVGARGRAADLIVLTRRALDDPTDVAAAVLLESGRPLLLVPDQPAERIGQRIAIAWKDKAEAARAVTAALPLLPTAAAVTVLSVAEADSDRGAAARLGQNLRWHNPATTVRIMQAEGGDIADRLLTAAKEIGADLLVMGGYSRSRIRELVFGGVTRRVLEAADVTVLMAH